MLITVLPGNEFVTASPEAPKPGRTYLLEDAATGTGAQNRAFHALVGEYWKSGMHSYPAKNYKDFRDMIKRDLGAGFEKFVYADIVDGKPVINEVATIDDIPSRIMNDPDMKKMVKGRLKSWGDYTSKERRESLDRLIAEMIQVGVNSTHFQEILAGMQEKSK